MAANSSRILVALALVIAILRIQLGEARDNIPCNKNIKPDWSDCGTERGLCCPIQDGD
jgi:hypothetical protein